MAGSKKIPPGKRLPRILTRTERINEWNSITAPGVAGNPGRGEGIDVPAPWKRVTPDNSIRLKDESGRFPVQVRSFSDSLSPKHALIRGRNTPGAPGKVAEGDNLGEYRWAGFFGSGDTDYATGALLRAEAAGAWQGGGSGEWTKIAGDSVDSSWNALASCSTSAAAPNGDIYTAPTEALYRKRSGTWAAISSPPSGKIRTIAIASTGLVYVGTDDSEIWELDPSDDSWTEITASSGWGSITAVNKLLFVGATLYAALEHGALGQIPIVVSWSGTPGSWTTLADGQTGDLFMRTGMDLAAEGTLMWVCGGAQDDQGRVYQATIGSWNWGLLGGSGEGWDNKNQVFKVLQTPLGLVALVYAGGTDPVECWALIDNVWSLLGGDGSSGSWSADIGSGTGIPNGGIAYDSTYIYVGISAGSSEGGVWRYPIAGGTWARVGGQGEDGSWTDGSVRDIRVLDGVLYAAISDGGEGYLYALELDTINRSANVFLGVVRAGETETDDRIAAYANGDLSFGIDLDRIVWDESLSLLAIAGSINATTQISVNDVPVTVAPSAWAADNRLLRADSTGRAIQVSAATLNDAGDLSGITSLLITSAAALDYHLFLRPVTDTSSRTKLVWQNAGGSHLWDMGMSSSSNMKMWDGTQNVIDWVRNGTMTFSPGGAIVLHDVNITTANHVTGVATLTLPNTGLHLLDTNASHDLIVKPGSNLTADRTLEIVTGDANRTLTLGGNASIDGTEVQAASAFGLANRLLISDGTGREAAATSEVTYIGGVLKIERSAAVAVQLARYTDNTLPGNVQGIKGRGTVASPEPVQASDVLFQFQARGQYDTTPGNFSLSGLLSAQAHENFDASSHGTDWRVRGAVDGATTTSQFLRIYQNTFVGGTLTDPTAGTNALVLEQGTALSGMPSNTGAIQVKDVSGTAEVFAVDEAANAAQLSPHNFTLFDPSPEDPYPWSYYCSNEYLGLEIGVDMAKALRLLEQLTGEKLIYTRALPGDRKDWEAHQDRLEAQAAEVLARWTPESDEPQPEPFIRKKRPKWLADRIKGDTGNVR